jgi:hypothetical protein
MKNVNLLVIEIPHTSGLKNIRDFIVEHLLLVQVWQSNMLHKALINLSQSESIETKSARFENRL